MIKKISKKEVEDLVMKHFRIKDVTYFRNNGCEGYGEDHCVDWEFIEGEEIEK